MARIRMCKPVDVAVSPKGRMVVPRRFQRSEWEWWKRSQGWSRVGGWRMSSWTWWGGEFDEEEEGWLVSSAVLGGRKEGR